MVACRYRMRSWAGAFLAAGILFTAANFQSCGGTGKKEEPGRDLSGSITVSGAGTTLALLVNLADHFHSRHQGVTFNFLPSSHSSGGITGTRNGILDIGAISGYYELTREDAGLETVYFCMDRIVFISHPDSFNGSLTRNQVLDIYSGKIRDWEDVGGNPGAIIVIDRPIYSSGKMIVNEAFFGPDFQFRPDRVILDSAEDALVAVEETRKAIGYNSLSIVRQRRSKVTIHPVHNELAAAGDILCRHHGIIFREKPSPHVKAFVDFLQSEEAGNLLKAFGCSPRCE